MAGKVFGDILKQTMGLDAAAIGPSAIAHAVQERMATCRLPDIRVYEEHLFTFEPELQQLIEAAVVPETWFFRDPIAFSEMARLLAKTVANAPPERVLRLLSLPCSTGEEPFSMAMAMLDAGFPSSRFRIEAVDISARALGRASGAVYGKNSFRGADLTFRARYFEPTAAGHRLSDAVRECVHFAQGNMLAADFLPGTGMYDAVFCRNLLVYFDQATQSRAIGIVRRLLSPAGTVFVGPAEAGMMFAQDFVWTKVPFAFAFNKGTAPAPAPGGLPHVAPSAKPQRRPASTPLETLVRPASVRATRHAAPVPSAAVAVPPAGLDEARRLADVGRVAEAAALCARHVRAHGPSAPAFHLMALMYNAAGDVDEATRCFRKAVYLDAAYADSLLHLALLLEKRGDANGARVLRDRLQRLRLKTVGAER